MEIKKHEPMKKHTSFRVGGPADWFVMPENAEELKDILSECREKGADWYVIGNGSNLLVSDEGFRGVIISTEAFGGIQITGTTMKAGAGVLLSKLASTACREGLAGLEFASGIPGSVGGAVIMNAGAYGSEIRDILISATVLDANGTIHRMKRDELELGYRTSAVARDGLVVLEAEFSLERGEISEIRGKMDELAMRRKVKQPLKYPSAGSTFKRPAGYFAGKLIEDAGLKGFSVGGAEVSDKHAGFVINKGNASAADIYRLCCEVQKRVLEHTGIKLELEVKLLGDFTDD